MFILYEYNKHISIHVPMFTHVLQTQPYTYTNLYAHNANLYNANIK